MNSDSDSGVVYKVQPVHKTFLVFPKELPERWVVWAGVKKDDLYPERVWIRTVVDDSDVLPLRLRSLLVKTFFEAMIGRQIEFSKKYDDVFEPCNSANEETIPEPYRTDSFSGIYRWFQENRPECLENDLKVLRDKRNREIQATKKENALGRLEERRRRALELEKRRNSALKLVFVRGQNPKNGNEQWQARDRGHLYVLRREDQYDPVEQGVPVEKVMDLVPNRISLVARI